jgi:GDP-L-fucose synthase
LILKCREDLDLLNTEAVDKFLREEKPDVIFIAAAKVGGIHANNTFRADFIEENLAIENNLVWGAHKADVRQVIFLGSSCIYPKEAPQPIEEKSLLTGTLEYTNRPYAIAKIAGMELINALRQQYGRDYFSVMPTNLYGPRDNFHAQNSHVLPALIRRFVEAVENSAPKVEIWGSGNPKREFMYSLDCADAIIHVAEVMDSEAWKISPQAACGYYHVNIGTGEDITIRETAASIAKAVGFEGDITFDKSKPDGTMRKVLNIDFLKSLGWTPSTDFTIGLEKTIAWYKSNRTIANRD